MRGGACKFETVTFLSLHIEFRTTQTLPHVVVFLGRTLQVVEQINKHTQLQLLVLRSQHV